MLVIAVSTAKGGTTKTTTAVNLAYGLTRRGYRVLLADLDSQMHSTLLLNDGNGRMGKGEGIDAVLTGERTIDQVAWPGRGGVHVLSSTRSPDGLPQLEHINLWLGSQLRREQLLVAALAKVRGQYDVVLLDCPPARNTIVENAHYAADWIVCPVALNSLHYHGIREVSAFATHVTGAPKPLTVLITLFRASCSKMNRKTLQLLSADVDAGRYEVFETHIPFTTDLDKAIDDLLPIYDAAPASAAARAFESLVGEVAAVLGTPTKQTVAA